jgi:hypothetical protein
MLNLYLIVLISVLIVLAVCLELCRNTAVITHDENEAEIGGNAV